ncbi:MAG: cysteine hydrolase family protein [Fusicatenibacter sp.]|nr:cysteine hydrolase [Fusicatenibacter sp.]
MKLLVVVDMQNDFIDGALGTKEAVSIVDRVKEKLSSYQNVKDCVVFTRDTHRTDYLNTQEGKNLPVEHCIIGTDGWQITPELCTQAARIIDKPTFGSMELASYIQEQKDLESVELVGLCTDICVISNALLIKAAVPEIPVIVDAACCAGVTPESHQNALSAMEMCQIQIRNKP